jgi:hypothetical protein
MSNIWADNFCLDKFKSKGYNLLLLDASPIFSTQDEIHRYGSGIDDYIYKADNLLQVNSFSELNEFVEELNYKTDIIWIINRFTIVNNFRNDDLIIFNKHKIRYFTGQGFLIPRNKLEIIKYNVIKYIIIYFRYQLSLLLNRVRNLPLNPTFVIGTGKAAREQANKIIPRMGDYVSLPSLNILWNEVKPLLKTDYIVYVDEVADFSPDIFLLGGERTVKSAERFHKNMNNLFKKIEDWIELPIVISTSGKFHYKVNPFDGRKLFYRQTQELIQHSTMVIGHKSSGLEQAIIERIPVLNVMDDEFLDLKNHQIKKLAANLFNQNAFWSHEINRNTLNSIQNVEESYLQQVEYDYYREQGLTGSFFENLNIYLSQLN